MRITELPEVGYALKIRFIEMVKLRGERKCK